MSNFNLLSCLEVVDLWLETIVAEVILNVAEVILYVAEVILSFHEINGFLSLQLGLSFELGLRLRLTNKIRLHQPLDIILMVNCVYHLGRYGSC